LDWADKALGQGISSVTRGVKNLLSGARQAPVAAALEALMEGKQVGVWDLGEGGGRGEGLPTCRPRHHYIPDVAVKVCVVMKMRVRGSRVGLGVDAPVAAALEALMEGNRWGCLLRV
jgi:hypothetical protein